MEIMEKTVGLAADLGVRIIQLAGYDIYYEDSIYEEGFHRLEAKQNTAAGRQHYRTREALRKTSNRIRRGVRSTQASGIRSEHAAPKAWPDHICVGHDSFFYKYSDALVTTLIAKDRVLAHNPVGAIYCAEGYFKAKLEP